MFERRGEENFKQVLGASFLCLHFSQPLSVVLSDLSIPQIGRFRAVFTFLCARFELKFNWTVNRKWGIQR